MQIIDKKAHMRCLLLFLGTFFSAGFCVADQSVTFAEKELTKEQFQELRRGGFVVYMRHGKTDPRQPDQTEVDFEDCSTQRLLSNEGRKIASNIGKHMRAAKIPINEIFVSPMCRTRESAQLVFTHREAITVLNELFSSTNQTSEQKIPIVSVTRRLLSSPVMEGGNRFILAHAPNLADTMGYFPKTEATVVVFMPKGDSFEYLGSILPDMWGRLLK